jgi:hypothetical protein
MATCSRPDCRALHEARGLCKKHYQQWTRGASFDAPLTTTPHGLYKTCSEPGCDRPHKAKGLCLMHWRRSRGAESGDLPAVAKLTPQQVREIRRLAARGWRNQQLAERFGVGRSNIRLIVTGRSWKHVR